MLSNPMSILAHLRLHQHTLPLPAHPHRATIPTFTKKGHHPYPNTLEMLLENKNQLTICNSPHMYPYTCPITLILLIYTLKTVSTPVSLFIMLSYGIFFLSLSLFICFPQCISLFMLVPQYIQFNLLNIFAATLLITLICQY